ncbi:MAG: right-handed parallel beta-helix repeat-containing protein [Clostridia bacterium]|nr:right-handed parallel beta-helix repeat-containing protein [Clostridia bacterium]
MEEMEAYVLSSTGNQKDRTEEIEKILKEKGSCVLGTGDFYVSGVKMPEGTTLSGLGEKSCIVLLPEVEEGAAVNLSAFCRIQNLSLTGSREAFERPVSLGKRHGVSFVGNAHEKDGKPQPRHAFISGLHITNFTGGGMYFSDTGVNLEHSSVVSDVRITFCGAGIWIPYYSEFHKFTNVCANRNFYGCINNGGNNVFSCCSFDGNTEGFLIDNSENQSPNSDHGSVIGCTFNHSDFNKGVGIRVLGAKHGFIFTSCQCFYSKIVLENSRGIQFANFNGGNSPIEVKGGGLVRFADCIWSPVPEFVIENNETVRVDNCYNRLGEKIELN